MKSSILKKKTFKSNSKEASILIKAGRDGAKNAIRASKALGLDITFMQNGIVYKEKPNGEKVVYKSTPIKKIILKDKLVLKKGMVFHAKN